MTERKKIHSLYENLPQETKETLEQSVSAIKKAKEKNKFFPS